MAVYDVEKHVIRGDRGALAELIPYLASKKTVIEHLGYHVIGTTEAQIARRIIWENCIFLTDEINVTDSLTSDDFNRFLAENENRIVFSPLAAAYLITPLEQRLVKIRLRAISENRKTELKHRLRHILSKKWVKAARIDSLMNRKDPRSLLLIASEFFKARYRFNEYPDQDEFVELLQYLTGTQFGVLDENNEIVWHLEKDLDEESKLNLLIYFSKYYKDYVWNDSTSVFSNASQPIETIGEEESLFERLNSEKDSVAMAAFIRLTTCDPAKVTALSDDYEKADIDASSDIPKFPYRFLKQLVILTEYCKHNGIDFKGSAALRSTIWRLTQKLTFQERRRIEDKLINDLSLDEITAFEYWSLVYEQSWDLTFSAGRVLDIFYSRNREALISGRKACDLYLKKCQLFDNIGIIGVCNSYRNKFLNSDESFFRYLVDYRSEDEDIMKQVQIVLASPRQAIEEDGRKSWEGNNDLGVVNPGERIRKAIKDNKRNPLKRDRAVSEVLSKISYEQIPEAFQAIGNYSFRDSWEKYSFVERDFGFFLAGDFRRKATRDEFLKHHATKTQLGLYSYYLDKVAIDYKDAKGDLDYDKIYELIKYDVVTAFVGGGGGKQNNEVYMLVKLLELTFNTTLDFPRKLCNSNNMYGCSSDDRAEAWMKYLERENLLKQKHSRVAAFGEEVR